jgi:hypothetical protein
VVLFCVIIYNANNVCWTTLGVTQREKGAFRKSIFEASQVISIPMLVGYKCKKLD